VISPNGVHCAASYGILANPRRLDNFW